jgi:hypothetical protein
MVKYLLDLSQLFVVPAHEFGNPVLQFLAIPLLLDWFLLNELGAVRGLFEDIVCVVLADGHAGEGAGDGGRGGIRLGDFGEERVLGLAGRVVDGLYHLVRVH